MENLNIINASRQYSTMIVLPTGGGKTYTMSMWLLKNALDQKKKILWIAHRQMLLDQAAEVIVSTTFGRVDKSTARAMIRERRSDIERLFA